MNVPDYGSRIFATIDRPLMVLDAHLRIRAANDAFLEPFTSGSDVVGRPLTALTGVPWHHPDLSTALSRVLSEHTAVDRFELGGEFGSGGDRTIILNARELSSSEESPEPLILVDVEDITERVRVASALWESERQLRAIFDHAAEAIVIFDDRGRFVDANPAAARLYDLVSPDALVGLHGREFSRPNDSDSPEKLQTMLMQGSLTGTARVVRRDGTMRDVEFAAVANIQPGRHLSIMRDVTEQLALQSQFRQAQRMESVGRLAGGVAHDFNNMLSAILGFTNLILTRAEGMPADITQDLDEIKKAGESAAALTRQLLAFSRQQLLEPTVLDLNEVIQRLHSILRRVIGEDVKLVLRPAADLGFVRADVGQIEQVIMNLAINARDAMPSGGWLTIETANVVLDPEYVAAHHGASPGPHVMLTVTDNGVGMNDAVKARIFEPFFTTKARDKGTGLGLSTVFGIVKQSGGSIWVYSEEALGTTVKVFLPVTSEAKRAAGDARPAALTGTETILIVEDQLMVLNLARRALQQYGYRVLTAATPGEALETAAREGDDIDVLITDVVLPEMSGREVARRIQTRHPSVRVLYMSGYTDDAIVRHGMLDAGLAFLQKPFVPETLAARVRQVLSSPSASPADQ